DVVGAENGLGRRRAVEGEQGDPAPTLLGRPAGGGVRQDLPHRPRGHAKEVDAVPPRLVGRGYQLQVSLVDERRRVERVAPAVAPHGRGQAAELIVDETEDTVQGLAVAAAGRAQEM